MCFLWSERGPELQVPVPNAAGPDTGFRESARKESHGGDPAASDHRRRRSSRQRSSSRRSFWRARRKSVLAVSSLGRFIASAISRYDSSPCTRSTMISKLLPSLDRAIRRARSVTATAADHVRRPTLRAPTLRLASAGDLVSVHVLMMRSATTFVKCTSSGAVRWIVRTCT